MEFWSLVGEKPTDFNDVWAMQRKVHAEVRAGERPDTVLFVEHSSVFTAGRRTHRAERPTTEVPVVDVDRGGKMTWHGPGQLVSYPIITLPTPVDVVDYIRRLEQAVMNLCATLGLATLRVEGRSGVWFPAHNEQPERKVCAIGARVAQGVTMHGLALNCDADLTAFDAIIPCGIADTGVTSLSVELGHRFTIQDAEPLLRDELSRSLTLSFDAMNPAA